METPLGLPAGAPALRGSLLVLLPPGSSPALKKKKKKKKPLLTRVSRPGRCPMARPDPHFLQRTGSRATNRLSGTQGLAGSGEAAMLRSRGAAERGPGAVERTAEKGACAPWHARSSRASAPRRLPAGCAGSSPARDNSGGGPSPPRPGDGP